MKLVKSLVLLVICLLFTEHIHAQSKISGKILDAQTKEVLIGASITEINTQNGTTSRNDGSFTLQVSSESGILEIRYLGYSTRKLRFDKSSNDIGIVYLKSSSILNDDVIVRAQRVNDDTPMAFKTIEAEEIDKVNLGQDLPYLLQMTPSVLSSSDAGAGIGYTYMTIRGIDQARINVTINGIPLNDAESHGVFWVNLPDLGSSVDQIQIQRGVGTSTNGPAAFGASVNISTTSTQIEPFAELRSSFGSFNTQTYTSEFGTGLLKNGWSFDARISQMNSDGYIDRASSDLESYYLNATYSGENQRLQFNILSGREKTYQAWWGSPEAIVYGNESDLTAFIERNFITGSDSVNLRNSGRTYNYYTYDNETDNYGQHHYQLHYSNQLTKSFNANISLHYTKGRGFFETFVTGGDFATYGLNPINVNGNTITASDLIRREWLDNDFYGVTFSGNWDLNAQTNVKFGGAANNYIGDHFGEVIWAQYAGNSSIRNRYYENVGEKSDFSGFVKISHELSNFIFYGDVQLRAVNYQFEGLDRAQDNSIQLVDLNDPLLFFNPKLGVTWNIAEKQRAFASFSAGNKEPTRNEYVNSPIDAFPLHETLYDYELGYQIGFDNVQIGLNAYWMQYNNQLIETGQINDVGEVVRQNIADSYRAGLEFSLQVELMTNLIWNTSLTASRNRVADYNQFIDNFDLAPIDGKTQQQVNNFSDTPLAQSPELLFNSSLQYNWKSLSAEWLSRYVSLQYLDNTGSEDKSIPAYFVSDFRFSYTLNNIIGADIELSLMVNNAFNELYANRGYTFSYIVGGQTITENYYYPQAERNVLGQIRIKF